MAFSGASCRKQTPSSDGLEGYVALQDKYEWINIERSYTFIDEQPLGSVGIIDQPWDAE